MEEVNVWLDDLRPAPRGWLWTKTVEETIFALGRGDVTKLSLDNDLGDGQPEGHLVVRWMVENDVWPKEEPVVHSANVVRSKTMREDVERHFRSVQSEEVKRVADVF